MKRITHIRIENFKAYALPTEINIPNGKNLIVYGENGSGKSSLFKALEYYLKSSRGMAGNFQKHHHQSTLPGNIAIRFEDIVGDSLDHSTAVEHIAADTPAASTNHQPFIQDAAVLRGFLDYTDLLKLYYDEHRNDLFDFIILHLLGDYIHISAGATKTIKQQWDEIQDCIFNVHNRNQHKHQRGLRLYSNFKTLIQGLLNTLSIELNRLLSTYFNDFNLSIDFDISLDDIQYGKHNRISEWRIPHSLNLKVQKDGFPINDYRHILNEARLSAMSICLYLAAIKLYPQRIDLKVLFLDDVFIGLNSANRRPIFNILNTEFREYQIIICTYDRSWYETMKSHLWAENINHWQLLEFYEGEKPIAGGLRTTHPLIINGKSNLELARFHLYNQEHPDYPAAANYYRKALEEILPPLFPKPCFKNDNLEDIPSYKLTQLLRKSQIFLDLLPNYFKNLAPATTALKHIMSYLHPLLHPLSHNTPLPVYKSELIKVEQNYILFLDTLKDCDLPSHCKIALEKGCRIRLTVKGLSKWECYYDMVLDEHLYCYKTVGGGNAFTKARCHAEILSGKKADGSPIPATKISATTKIAANFRYLDFDDAYNKICTFLKTQKPFSDIDTSFNSVSEIEYLTTTKLRPLKSLPAHMPI